MMLTLKTNRNSTFTFVHGGGQQPLRIFQDKKVEYFCFPNIFCGQRRMDNKNRPVPVHCSDIAKWELRSMDRRAGQQILYLIYFLIEKKNK